MICRCLFSLIDVLLLCYQATQLTCIIDRRLKEAAEVIKREKALKVVAEVTTKEKEEAATAS